MGPPDANAPEARPYKPPPAASTSTYQRRPWPRALDRRWISRATATAAPRAPSSSAARTSARSTRPRRRRAPRPLRRRLVDASGTRLRPRPWSDRRRSRRRGQRRRRPDTSRSALVWTAMHRGRSRVVPRIELSRHVRLVGSCGVALALTRSGGSERVEGQARDARNGRNASTTRGGLFAIALREDHQLSCRALLGSARSSAPVFNRGARGRPVRRSLGRSLRLDGWILGCAPARWLT
jgi:hypothetical protein